MGFFDLFNGMKKAVDRQINPQYSQNKDFLEACAAAAASVAFADGELEDSERTAIVDLLTAHPLLGKLYQSNEIRTVVDTMFARASTFSGRLQLNREIDDIKGKGNTMAQDVYMIALDVSMADGTMEDEEKVVLERLATRLGVDVKALGL